MNTRTRITIGISCCVIGIGLISIDHELRYLGALFTIAGALTLRSELMSMITLLRRTANKRADKVAIERRCALCSAPPIYMLHLIEIDGTQPISPFVGSELHVCRAHHPNEKVGPKADELHQLIEGMGKNLTYDRVYPYIFHET